MSVFYHLVFRLTLFVQKIILRKCSCSFRTQLPGQNTEEYKKREAYAIKLAKQIESSETYKARIALENDDGDEEDKFSAVKRPGKSHSTAGK